MPLAKYMSGGMWRMRWAGHVASLEIWQTYRILVGPQGKRSLWRPRQRWETILKCILQKQHMKIQTIPYWPECKMTTLRWPLKITCAKGKCIYPNLRWPHKNKCLLRKNILPLMSNTLHTKHVIWYLLLPKKCHCLHLQSRCLRLPHIHF